MKYDECPRYLDIYAKVVHPYGPCESIEGECLRAAANLGYQWYTNGDMPDGENKPIEFLRKVASLLIDSGFSTQRFRALLGEVDEGISTQKFEQGLDGLIGYIVMEIERIGLDKLTDNRRDSIGG